MNYENSWTSPGEGFIKEAMPKKGQKDPYVGNVDGGWDVMKADGTMVKAFGRNGENAAKAYLKKNFKKLSEESVDEGQFWGNKAMAKKSAGDLKKAGAVRLQKKEKGGVARITLPKGSKDIAKYKKQGYKVIPIESVEEGKSYSKNAKHHDDAIKHHVAHGDGHDEAANHHDMEQNGDPDKYSNRVHAKMQDHHNDAYDVHAKAAKAHKLAKSAAQRGDHENYKKHSEAAKKHSESAKKSSQHAHRKSEDGGHDAGDGDVHNHISKKHGGNA